MTRASISVNRTTNKCLSDEFCSTNERAERSPFKQPGNDTQRPLLALPPRQLRAVILINFQCLLTNTRTKDRDQTITQTQRKLSLVLLTNGTARSMTSLKISIHRVITVLSISWKGSEYCSKAPWSVSALININMTTTQRNGSGPFQPRVLHIYLNKSVEDLEDLFLDENREDAGVSQHLTNELLNPRQEDVHGCQQWFSFIRLPVPKVHGAKQSKSIFIAATQS